MGSMYGIFTYIWLIFMVNVGKYTSPMDPMDLLEGSFVFSPSKISATGLRGFWILRDDKQKFLSGRVESVVCCKVSLDLQFSGIC